MNLKNKIALITGSSRGLGRNIALQMAAKGADIIVTYRGGQAEAEAVAKEVEAAGSRAAILQIDVAQSGTFGDFAKALAETLDKTWGRQDFDFLVNNAGIDRYAKITDATEKDLDDLYNIHFKGVFLLTQTLLPLLADGGRIVNTSTGLARFALPGYAAYASMKGAVEVFTRYLAKELGGRKITANVVAPGAIETDFTAHALSTPGVAEMIASQTCLGRVGVPDDIGGVVAFLCSEEGRWVNAQRVEASGGMFV